MKSSKYEDITYKKTNHPLGREAGQESQTPKGGAGYAQALSVTRGALNVIDIT